MPYLLLTLTTLFWSGNIVIARAISGDIPPVTLAAVRWALAFTLLLPFAWRYLRDDLHAVRQHWVVLAILSAFGIAGFNTCLYIAVQTTTATNGALIQTTMPAAIVLIGWLGFRDRLRFVQGVAVVICAFGALLVVRRGQVFGTQSVDLVPGDLWILGGVVLYAVYTNVLRRRPAMHELSFLAATIGMGAAGLFPASMIELLVSSRSVNFSSSVLAAIVYFALFPSLAAYLFWNRGVAAIGPARAGLFVNLIPVSASLLGVALLNERIMAYHVAGFVVILIGIVLFNVTASRTVGVRGSTKRS